MLGGQSIVSPIYFPSISSVKTSLSLLSYVKTLRALNQLTNTLLISAYDVAHLANDVKKSMYDELHHAIGEGMIVMMDSGNYESFWKEKQDIWTPLEFHKTLRECPHSVAFSYDNQTPPPNSEDHVKILVESYNQDVTQGKTASIIPIVHGEQSSIPRLCVALVSELQVPWISVAERELGVGVYERMRTVKRIRDRLDASGHTVSIHVLGTGNPISIALLTLAGANSYDGLEWCQTVVDYDTGSLFHLSQADFFRTQSTYWNEDISHEAGVLAHNLEFYNTWMSRLQYAHSVDDVRTFCQLYFPQSIYSICARELNWDGE